MYYFGDRRHKAGGQREGDVDFFQQGLDKIHAIVGRPPLLKYNEDSGSKLLNLVTGKSMKGKTEIAAFRVPRGTVARLKMMAHRRSLESGREVTWSSMVRE